MIVNTNASWRETLTDAEEKCQILCELCRKNLVGADAVVKAADEWMSLIPIIPVGYYDLWITKALDLCFHLHYETYINDSELLSAINPVLSRLHAETQLRYYLRLYEMKVIPLEDFNSMLNKLKDQVVSSSRYNMFNIYNRLHDLGLITGPELLAKTEGIL